MKVANVIFPQVWRLMEEPASSIWSKIISVLSVAVIFLSIWSFCIETLPSSKKLLDDVCVPINITDDTRSMPGVDSTIQAFITIINSTVAPITTDSDDFAQTTAIPVKPPCRVDLWRYVESFCLRIVCERIMIMLMR